MTLPALAHEWVDKAEEDWAAATTLLREDVAYGPTCFHAHQTAEKYLKAFWAAHNELQPRRHDLLELLRQCQNLDEAFYELAEHATNLNPLYIDTRYPGNDAQPYSRQIAQEAVASAEAARAFVRQKFSL